MAPETAQNSETRPNIPEPAGPAGPVQQNASRSLLLPCFTRTGGRLLPAARVAAGLIQSGSATGGRAGAGRGSGGPSPSLSPSRFLPFSLADPCDPPRLGSAQAVRPATIAGRTSTGLLPGSGGVPRPKLGPGQPASTPPGPNQGAAGSLLRNEDGRRRSPPPPTSPVPHRTLPPVPVGSSTGARARRGGEHAAGPEPRIGRFLSASLYISLSVRISLSHSASLSLSVSFSLPATLSLSASLSLSVSPATSLSVSQGHR